MSNDFEDIAITRTSQLSGIRRTQTFRIRYADYIRYQEGVVIQKAMPYLDADQREFLMTGITTEEWEQMFGEPPATTSKPLNGTTWDEDYHAEEED
jgi:hypothetical protein